MKVTKWSIFNGELTVSDQEPNQISGETGSVSAGISHSTDKPGDQVAASATEATAAKDAGLPEPVVSEPVAPEPSMSELSMSEPVLSEPVLSEAAQVEAVKAEVSAQATQPETAAEKISHTPGKVIVMPRGDRAWADHDSHVRAEEAAERQSLFGKRRIAAIAAVAALAAVAGALGGAFATATFMHGGNEVVANSSPTSMQASLSRIDADLQALKTGLDHTSKLGMNQFNKTSDRLDKLERAQAEPAGKLAKLSEAVDKLRAAPAATPVAAAAVPVAAVASKEVTGSIGSVPAQQQAAAAPVPKTEPRNETKIEAKTEVGRLPTIEGWVLRDVAYGAALIESRRGSYDVYAGDIIPGLGRVDAIRRQDGRWVVVTSRGLIVAR
jgi:hypothetical protein